MTHTPHLQLLINECTLFLQDLNNNAKPGPSVEDAVSDSQAHRNYQCSLHNYAHLDCEENHFRTFLSLLAECC